MKIIDKRLSGSKEFCELEIGDCYKDGDFVYMKTMLVTVENGMKLNCIDLATGLPYYQGEHSVVVPVDAELFIYTKR